MLRIKMPIVYNMHIIMRKRFIISYPDYLLVITLISSLLIYLMKHGSMVVYFFTKIIVLVTSMRFIVLLTNILLFIILLIIFFISIICILFCRQLLIKFKLLVPLKLYHFIIRNIISNNVRWTNWYNIIIFYIKT